MNHCTFCPHSLLNMSQKSGLMKSDPDLKLFGVEKNPPEFEEEDLDFPASVKSTLPVSSLSSSSSLSSMSS